MNCYECKHKGSVAGSAHSSCKAIQNHPLFSDLNPKQKGLLEMAPLLSGKFPLEFSDGRKFISFNPHGQRNGWCNWPMDFDPVWIDGCVLMEQKSNSVTFEKIES